MSNAARTSLIKSPALRTVQHLASVRAKLPSYPLPPSDSCEIHLALNLPASPFGSFKLASSRTPPTPPLTSSSSGRSPSVDSTPIGTPPCAAETHFPPHRSRDETLFFDWHKKAAGQCNAIPDTFCSDDLLFPHDDDEASGLSLFPAASPLLPPPRAAAMPGAASPIDIATSRRDSSSPRTQQSNLTSQLLQPNNDQRMMAAPEEIPHRNRPEQSSMLSTTPYGARQIPSGTGRRESYQMSGSLANGMSWGGISMGSFIRDDIMTGTSPYNFQSPSFHSSSYLPKMEANYMKDYVCCDIHLDSMHELLQHYEEAHAAQPTQTMGRTPKDQQFPSSRAANASSTAQSVQQQAQAHQGVMPQQQHTQHNQPPPINAQSPLFSGQSNDQIGTFDNLDDMDMDDGISTPQVLGSQFQPQPQFGRQQPRGPSVNVNLANAFQGQGLNSADPTTPHVSQQGMGFPHNPTVSSVNTPSLTTQSPSLQTATPDPSQPSTPAELDPDFLASMNGLSNLEYNQLLSQGGAMDFSNLNGMGGMQNGGSATIDNPEKRLLSKQGYGNKGFPSSNPAFVNSNSELAKRVRENQLLNGLAGVGGFVGEEIKPFKCPVIGCEKAYKNQNGLKYHKQHGHQNQQLKENPDGTFSIVDPTTSIPYPGTVGMEKEKPYRCEVCGKRYKNLNGLKYHRQHSPPCNPDLKMNGGGMPGNLNNNANVAGAGLVGMNDGMGY